MTTREIISFPADFVSKKKTNKKERNICKISEMRNCSQLRVLSSQDTDVVEGNLRISEICANRLKILCFLYNFAVFINSCYNLSALDFTSGSNRLSESSLLSIRNRCTKKSCSAVIQICTGLTLGGTRIDIAFNVTAEQQRS